MKGWELKFARIDSFAFLTKTQMIDFEKLQKSSKGPLEQRQLSPLLCKASDVVKMTSLKQDFTAQLFFFFGLFRAASEAYGGSQARMQVYSLFNISSLIKPSF